MSLFTVIMEFEGGTYASQVTAEHEASVLKNWISKLETKAIPRIGEKIKKRMLQDIYSDEERYQPVLLKDCYNVWCVTFLILGRFMLLTIIKTEQDG
ncbi:hypothetical protein DNI29_21305 [Hymenobacter sediminis]|uniref:hypothetical protein n=1 Tax=Hymenobacter sediminis TaxID=2218621 RepID=UPI000DA6564B|nr:hypothetical protein [Hymenobacter sediminis]RPD44669.1 hypothetical protein DNI29_21305 [Hymenobacter sediminis]